MNAHDKLMQGWDESIEHANYLIALLDIGDEKRRLDHELINEIEERTA